MPDAAESHKTDNGTSQTEEDQELSPESVSAKIENYRLAFEEMASKLEFGQALEDGEMKELVRKDISTYLKDIIQFSTYVRTWEAQIPKISDSFNSMEGIHEKLQNAGKELNVALAVDTALKSMGSNMEQFDKGKDAYSTRLTNCSNLLRQMLDECFKKDNGRRESSSSQSTKEE